MTCTHRVDSDQAAYSQGLVSRLYESLLDTLWVDKDQKFKWTAKTDQKCEDAPADLSHHCSVYRFCNISTQISSY